MNATACVRRSRVWVAGLVLALAAGCAALRPPAAPPPAYFSLDDGTTVQRLPMRAGLASPTLRIEVPRAAPGFDTRRMVYVREAHRLEVFARSEWVDTPARLLAPLIVAAIEAGGAVRAVVLAPNAVAGDLRLETEIVRLQQQFGASPSELRFTLRATLLDPATRRVLASREFDAGVPAPSEDARGGVLAANGAVRAVLQQLAAFVAETANDWQPPEGSQRREVSLPAR